MQAALPKISAGDGGVLPLATFVPGATPQSFGEPHTHMHPFRHRQTRLELVFNISQNFGSVRQDHFVASSLCLYAIA